MAEPQGEPPVELPELEPLEAHIVALRAELARMQLVVTLAAAASLVGALAVLYVAKGAG